MSHPVVFVDITKVFIL